jgi:serine/threonine protein kinase
MEFCEGKNLREVIKEQTKPLPESYILRLFFQMVDVLKFCHEKKVMHRDLKPENIIITPDNQVKLIDFGVAKVLQEGASVVSTYAGSPNYMSPELIQGKKYSFSSDVWSLGIIIYEMMTFKRPFDDQNQLEMNKKICFQDLPPITLNYSVELIEVVKYLLSKNPVVRMKLKTLITHLTLWDFDKHESNLNTLVERLKKENHDQREVIQHLESENQRMKNLETQVQLFQAENQRLRSIEVQAQQIWIENQKLKSVEEQSRQLNIEIQRLRSVEEQSRQLNIENQRLRSIEVQAQQIWTENQMLKTEIQKLQKSPQRNLVQEGLMILRNNPWDEESQKRAFPLFLKAVDEENVIEAYWMVAACYRRGMETPKYGGKANLYAKRAHDAGFINGTFWLGESQNSDEEKFPFYKQAADHNNLAGKFRVGWCTLYGEGTPKNEKRAKEIFEEIINVGERYWTIVYAWWIEKGLYGLKGNANANTIYAKARSQPIADCSLFNPWGISCSELKAKW